MDETTAIFYQALVVAMAVAGWKVEPQKKKSPAGGGTPTRQSAKGNLSRAL